MLRTRFLYFAKLIATLIGSLLGTYIAVFWVADGRYNIAISRLESRVTNIITRLESENWRKAIELVPNLQNRKIPLKPAFIYIKEVYHSLLTSHDEVDTEIIEELQNILISKKEALYNLNLAYVILNKLDLTRSNFTNSNLQGANLAFSNFSNSIFNHTDMSNTSLVNTNFTNTKFEGANLTNSNLQGSILIKAKLLGTKLISSNLTNVDFSSANLHFADLLKSTLYNSNLSKSNLVGANLEGANGLETANLYQAKYNSRPIRKEEIPLYKEIVLNICNKMANEIGNIDQLFYEDCSNEALKNFELSYGLPTKFPEGFDPKAHRMIDVNEIIDKLKTK